LCRVRHSMDICFASFSSSLYSLSLYRLCNSECFCCKWIDFSAIRIFSAIHILILLTGVIGKCNIKILFSIFCIWAIIFFLRSAAFIDKYITLLFSLNLSEPNCPFQVNYKTYPNKRINTKCDHIDIRKFTSNFILILSRSCKFSECLNFIAFTKSLAFRISGLFISDFISVCTQQTAHTDWSITK
jgi:hypothetical protein